MFTSLLRNKIEYNIMTGNTSYTTSNDEILPKELTQINFRRGKWTTEEENYTSRIIKDFENGEFERLQCFIGNMLPHHCKF